MISISNIKQRMVEIVGHETGEEQWTRLFATQNSGARTVQVLKSNKTLKGCGNQALVNYNSERNRRSQNKLLNYPGYDCLLFHHNSNCEESVRQKAEPHY